MRTCIGCSRKAAAEELVRVVWRPDGALGVGRALPGRGAWLCAGSPQCVDRAERRRAFDRAFRSNVPPAAVAALREVLGDRAAPGAAGHHARAQLPERGRDEGVEGPRPLMCEDREPGSPHGGRQREGH